MRELTEQEHFWRGDFGDDYAERNQGNALIAANVALFTKALARAQRLGSVLELGTNTGNNLRALSGLLSGCELSGVEINAYFAGEMLDCYGDLQLLDYGFVYRRDPQFPADDITWFPPGKRP